MNRKEALKIISTSAAGVGLGFPIMAEGDQKKETTQLKGNINHSACRWCYKDIELEAFCEAAKEMGLSGIDLLKPSEWNIATKYGLTCSMGNPEEFSLTEGFNDPKLHDELVKKYIPVIDQASDMGLKNIICFSGNRNGLDEETGLENCAQGLEKLVKHAEKKNIVLSMELLNSKVNHPDYQCDNSKWGVALCEKIGSENFKLLYDIYHMQIMEGDIIATIQKNHQYYAHYHTGGVPGRHEINDVQELNYPAIMKAILDTGYQGYVAQEFVPTREDELASLKEGIMICDV
ncbi:MAG: TIM barrel protein [Cyclobacteriaceae bacterium]